jgi:hypothetical protein
MACSDMSPPRLRTGGHVHFAESTRDPIRPQLQRRLRARHHPNQPGSFHFWLKRGFDTSRYPDGQYLLEVEASDIRDNTRTHDLTVTIDNTG